MKVLVVEDSERLRKSIVNGLIKHEFVVESACDGNQGLSFIKAYEFDVILLDIMMPGHNGLELLKYIREKQIQVGVIMLTALDQIEERVEGLDKGADDYICKPFAFAELVARIRTAGRRNTDFKQSKIIFGPITIDLGCKEVMVNEENTHLTATEYQIMESLLLRAGKLVRFSTLEELLSSNDKYMSRNSLEVNVFNIRKKLKERNVFDFIRTKRGMGYFVESKH